MNTRVLVVEPDPAQAEALEITLAEWGYAVSCTSDAASAPAKCAGGPVDVVLWGLGDGAQRGAEARLRRLLPEAAWIDLLSPEELEGAPGTGDAVVRPVDPTALRLALRRAENVRALRRENALLREQLDAAVGDRPIVAASPSMIRVLEDTERAAGSERPALLVGERGTGREGLARAIHAQSARRRGPFVAVVCRPGPEGERALFGEVEGGTAIRRGPIQAADRGTLYLDAIEQLSGPAQERLGELLRSGTLIPVGSEKPGVVDVRLVAATSAPLEAHVQAGDFDAGLLQRLHELTLRVPALRDRREDIPLLVDHFLARACRGLARPLRGLDNEALGRLSAYDWPGNVRELEGVIERAVLLARGDTLTVRDLAADLESKSDAETSPEGDFALRRSRRRAEIEVIRRALRRTGGNRTHAAKLLEISHRALLYKLKEYALKD